MNKTLGILLLVFLIALVLRFLFFPDNIYFGFDQARDGFVALDILKGDLKIVGPSTSFEGLHHGVLYYYILVPFYALGNNSPEFAAAALRVFNAMGVFLIYYIAQIIFNKKVALFASIIFAFSFEANQFSIYMGNPTMAVLTVMLMYLGLALVIFKNNWLGLPLSLLGLGFSIQFQFALIYLSLPWVVLILIFRESLTNITAKGWLISGLGLILSLSSFIWAEIKYNFQTVNAFLSLITSSGGSKNIINIITTYLYTISKMASFNITASLPYKEIVLLLLLLAYIILIVKKKFIPQLIFLGVWFFSLIIIFIINGGVDLKKETPLYYPNIGISAALIIFVAFLLGRLIVKRNILTFLLLTLIIMANLSLITKLNPKGTISEINVQSGMILSDEKKVLDYIYQESAGQPFAVKALTMPLYINTTWSYLFEWYGQGRYGYLPIWNGRNAEGFPGNLTVQEAQEGLPTKRFVIIEPTRGIAPYLIDDFLKEEGYFTKIVEVSEMGMFKVQKREKY